MGMYLIPFIGGLEDFASVIATTLTGYPSINGSAFSSSMSFLSSFVQNPLPMIVSNLPAHPALTPLTSSSPIITTSTSTNQGTSDWDEESFWAYQFTSPARSSSSTPWHSNSRRAEWQLVHSTSPHQKSKSIWTAQSRRTRSMWNEGNK